MMPNMLWVFPGRARENLTLQWDIVLRHASGAYENHALPRKPGLSQVKGGCGPVLRLSRLSVGS